MGEIKSVKVDNWGVFFLQKLQNFFNKTDYCDLTLQFNDNSQLKVHRLVLSACTDYFNVLEQTCEMIEDILIMPPELQADVVVPIVNFMYTGTLEFELKMYGRLLKTAKDMNMTVLLKLLEAHRRTMEGNKPQANANKIAQKNMRRIPFTAVKTEERHYSNQSATKLSPRRAVNSTQQYKTLQIKPINPKIYSGTNLPETAQILTKYPHSKTTVKGPSRFDCNEDVLPPETFEKSFDNISYESKPLICKEDPDAFDYDNLIRKHETYSSTFEQLRRGYTNNNNKRPLSSASSYDSPPEKKPNIQDVKEYAEQQRVRKQIAEEFDEEQDFDEVVDDEFHNDDDDDDYVPPQHIRKQFKQKPKKVVPSNQPKISKPADKNPTFLVKDSTASNVNHAKIISEVLRKYPHLVKNTKNIKLKIMPQSNNSQKIVIKKDDVERGESSESKPQMRTSTPLAKPVVNKAPAPSAPSSGQPRRIDSKTMHSLIAQGAENRTGPWLCLRCGINGRPISIPSYRGFRRHLINIHKEKIDPHLCEHCGWRSTNNRELAFHSLMDHSIKPPSMYNFPACVYCSKIHVDGNSLSKHIDEKHFVAEKNSQSCIYCKKGLKNDMQMYNHMKKAHKKRALEDGILDESDTDMSFDEEMDVEESPSKIKIISDISLPKNIPVVSSDPATKTSTTGNDMLSSDLIETDSSQGPKFVSPDGNEMDLTPAQREEIISQLSSTHEGVVMVLNEAPFDSPQTVGDLGANEQMVVSSEQMEGNSMFIVCGQDPEVEGQQSGSKDPLSWAGEESQEHVQTVEKVKQDKEEVAEDDDKKKSDEVVDTSDAQMEQIDDDDDERKNDKSTTLSKKAISESNDSIEMKLKLLTDWTDDDEEDEDHPRQTEKPESISEIVKDNESTGNKEELLFETLTGVEVDDPKETEPDEIEVKSEPNISENVPAEEKGNKDAELDEDCESSDNKDKKISSDKNVDEEITDEKPEKLEQLKEEEEDNRDVEKKIKELTEGDDTGDEEEKVIIKSSEKPESTSKNKKKGETLITKAELRNIMNDWGEEDDDDDIDEEI